MENILYFIISQVSFEKKSCKKSYTNFIRLNIKKTRNYHKDLFLSIRQSSTTKYYVKCHLRYFGLATCG